MFFNNWRIKMNFENIIVSRGKSSDNQKYRLSIHATTKHVKLPQQAFDVLRAMDEDGMNVAEIAAVAEIKTRQSKERIVKYYIPMLLKEELIEKS
jgi:hypothetical protein